MSPISLRRVRRQIQGCRFSNQQYELQYQAAYEQAAIRNAYIFCWVVVIASTIFSVVEFSMYSRILSDPIQIFRSGIIIFFVALGIHVRMRPQAYAYRYALVFSMVLVFYSAAILILEFWSQVRNHPEFIYLSVNSICVFLTIATYCFIGLPIKYAFSLAMYFMFATFATIYVSDVFNSVAGVRLLTYVVVGNIIGLVLRQLLDTRERRLFLQTKRLNNVAALRQRLVHAETEANRAKIRFLAMLSHEIRTPMQTIVGLINLVKKDVKEQLTEKRVNTFNLVGQSCDRLLGTFDDLLEYAHLGHSDGYSQKNKSSFRLDDLIDECYQSFGYKAEEKGIILNIKSTQAGKIELIGEPRKLVRVIANLIGNAIKFTHLGHIEVSTKVIGRPTVDTFRVQIMISDSGIGIRQSDLGRIFQPFYQVDAEWARRYEGSGLGLAICKQLVEDMDGKLSVASELGRGSTFTVDLTLQGNWAGPDELALST